MPEYYAAAYLIYGVPLDYEKTSAILKNKLEDAIKECKNLSPELCAFAEQERCKREEMRQLQRQLRKKGTRSREQPMVQLDAYPLLQGVKRVVPSLFHLCSWKVRNDCNHKALMQRLPAEVQQRMAREKYVKRLIEFSLDHSRDKEHEILWLLLGLVLLKDEEPFSFERDEMLSSVVTPGIVRCSTKPDTPHRDHLYFLTLGGRCTKRRERRPVVLHELECTQMAQEEQPLWWTHALQILQIEDSPTTRPNFHLCVDHW